MIWNILPELQRFLLDKNIAPKKNAGFYAYWASKFIKFSNDNQLDNPSRKEIWDNSK